MSLSVTIIMPVYNASEFLAETLDSIVAQTMRDFELIAINDGSVDNSLEIINEYAKKYSFIKIIDQENAGPSVARNAALDIAQGEYIFFCDSDDLVEKDGLENLYYTAKNIDADLVIANYDIFNHHTTTCITNLNKLLVQSCIHPSNPDILNSFALWNKIFRKELIDQYQFRFPSTSYSEDGVFVMNYVYHCRLIAGLNKIVYHYRRINDAMYSSITASISPDKVSDYITSHNLIWDSASKYFLRIYPKYRDIDEAISQNNNIRSYMNKFLYKEVQILVGQFYKKFWTLDSETIAMIVNEIQRLTGKLDLYNYNLLKSVHYELPLEQLFKYPSDLEGHYLITLVLYGDKDIQENFIDVLRSYNYQTFIPIRIVVPLHMKPFVESNNIIARNIFYVEADSSLALFDYELNHVQTDYIIFGHTKIVYNTTALLKMYHAIAVEQLDFVSNLVYTKSVDKPVPIALHKKAFKHFDRCRSLQGDGYFDCLYANKLIRTSFLKENHIDFSHGITNMLENIFRIGYFKMLADCNSIYTDSEYSFPEDMLKHCNDPEVKCYAIEQPVTLFSPEVQNSPELVVPKLLGDNKPKSLKKKVFRFAIKMLRLLPVMKKVFFVNIRKDDELEGNAKALEPYITGKKVICSKVLPHNRWYKLKMYYHTLTSKVIICDDYNRYLRIFPLKSEQRVVQLWHACGAFKKFGKYGTTLSQKVDLSTHIQYNLVCVSASNIRSVYADAFDISITKVKALGCPRTDVFFDPSYIEEKCKAIYNIYPELQNKEVIIYAPTFRDNVKGQDRTIFTPPLDFARLSDGLSERQMFVICPHPLMKNQIVSQKFTNILEIRDFSTNDMMFVSDILITDYSSVIFEYALLRKPMAFYCYDLNIYERGFYLSYPDDLPGDVLMSTDDILSFLSNEARFDLNEKYNQFVKNYMAACDGHSSERIAKLINGYMEG